MWRFFWERQCSEEEATQSECNGDRTRSEFLLCSEVLMANWDLTQSTNRKTKSMCRFSVRCWDLLLVTWLKLEAQTGRRVSNGCTERRPGDKRATSPTSPTDGRQSRAEDDLIQVGEAGVIEQTCAEKEKRTDFGRTLLKLSWVVIGWLPPLSRVHQQLYFSHL